MHRAVTVAPLAIEAAILAAIVAGIAAIQAPDTAARRDLLVSPSPITEGWIERNPLLFGGAVGVLVFVLGILLITATCRRS